MPVIVEHERPVGLTDVRSAQDTVRKMLKHAARLGYRRSKPSRRPEVGPYTPAIDEILHSHTSLPKKHRHTARRIPERLRDQHGFEGGYTHVKDYVRERCRTTREMSVSLSPHANTHVSTRRFVRDAAA